MCQQVGSAMASILLITPDRAFEDYAMQVLSTAGHQIIRAGNAEEAARAALTLPVDVVVADSLASDLPDARERLEAAGRRVAFVFVSPSATKWAAQGLPLRDGDRLVRKPASSGELRAAVAELLRATEVMGNQLDLSGVTFDRVGQRLRRGAEVEQLTLTEFHLLDYLASVRGHDRLVRRPPRPRLALYARIGFFGGRALSPEEPARQDPQRQRRP